MDNCSISSSSERKEIIIFGQNYLQSIEPMKNKNKKTKTSG